DDASDAVQVFRCRFVLPSLLKGRERIQPIYDLLSQPPIEGGVALVTAAGTAHLPPVAQCVEHAIPPIPRFPTAGCLAGGSSDLPTMASFIPHRPDTCQDLIG